MIITIDRGLSTAINLEDYTLDEYPFEVEVGPAELSAATRVFEHGSDLDRWSFSTPTGYVELQRTEAGVGQLRAFHLTALPWVYKVLFGTPAGFVDAAVRTIDIKAAVLAYATYLALRTPEDGDQLTATEHKRVSDVLDTQAADVNRLLDPTPDDLIERLRDRVVACVTSREETLGRKPRLSRELHDDHVATLAALASANSGGDAIDQRAQHEAKMYMVNIRQLPPREIELLERNTYGLYAVSHQRGLFVEVPEAVTVSSDTRRELPILTTLLDVARDARCAWISFDHNTPLLKDALVFSDARDDPSTRLGALPTAS